MMVSPFEKQLKSLNAELALMGSMCENAIAISAKALLTGDKVLAEGLSELSASIDSKEREIEGLCLKLLLRQHPIAGDLRTVSSALKMVTDMERIGDQSADISEIILSAQIPPDEMAKAVHGMATATLKMVRESIEAFLNKDRSQAREVIAFDDTVDNYFTEIKSALIEQIALSKSARAYALDLLMIAKYFERIGDHAVNIARWVIFSITGQIPPK